MTTRQMLKIAKAQCGRALLLTEEEKNRAILAMADRIEAEKEFILAANAKDMEAAQYKLSAAMLDRLMLNESRVAQMTDGMRKVAALPDPVGRVLSRVERPNGLTIEKTTVPIGVVAIIYESRPNVTSDAAVLAFKSSNVCVLRSGRDSFLSATAIVAAMRRGLADAGLSEDFIHLVPDPSRASASELMKADGLVDVLIPRGGAGLIQSCLEQATVPCIQTGTGICHIYVHESANWTDALNILDNAKTQRPSVCNAMEVCLVDRAIAKEFLPLMKKRLVDDRQKEGLPPVELRLCPAAQSLVAGTPAEEKDFDTEFLDYVLAVKVVDGLQEAVAHIAEHSTGHSEAILCRDSAVADAFCRQVDSAAVYVNASTRFTDGGEFGLGCEMGIATQKLHARGPMGLAELVSYKYIVRGNGQIR